MWSKIPHLHPLIKKATTASKKTCENKNTKHRPSPSSLSLEKTPAPKLKSPIQNFTRILKLHIL